MQLDAQGLLWASQGISLALLGLGSESTLQHGSMNKLCSLARTDLLVWDSSALMPTAFHVCLTLHLTQEQILNCKTGSGP